MNVRILSRFRTDPTVRDRPIVLVAVALDQPCRDIRDGDHGSLRADDELGQDFQELRFDLRRG